jgi:hypothetical protein
LQTALIWIVENAWWLRNARVGEDQGSVGVVNGPGDQVA